MKLNVKNESHPYSQWENKKVQLTLEWFIIGRSGGKFGPQGWIAQTTWCTVDLLCFKFSWGLFVHLSKTGGCSAKGCAIWDLNSLYTYVVCLRPCSVQGYFVVIRFAWSWSKTDWNVGLMDKNETHICPLDPLEFEGIFWDPSVLLCQSSSVTWNQLFVVC